jgi:hypothetical protein
MYAAPRGRQTGAPSLIIKFQEQRPRPLPAGVFDDEKMYLSRVVVDESEQPALIVTAYRASKIEKYWSAE